MIKANEYNMIEIEEYNGVYSIVEGWVDRDGNFKPRWVKEEFGKRDAKVLKDTPKRIRLGDAATARMVAMEIFEKLGIAKEAQIAERTVSRDKLISMALDGDIPF